MKINEQLWLVVISVIVVSLFFIFVYNSNTTKQDQINTETNYIFDDGERLGISHCHIQRWVPNKLRTISPVNLGDKKYL